jgi:hypothetical protein
MPTWRRDPFSIRTGTGLLSCSDVDWAESDPVRQLPLPGGVRPHYVCALAGSPGCICKRRCPFIDQRLGNLEGRQTRPTRLSSTLGQFSDHGCDALTSPFDQANTSEFIHRIGPSGPRAACSSGESHSQIRCQRPANHCQDRPAQLLAVSGVILLPSCFSRSISEHEVDRAEPPPVPARAGAVQLLAMWSTAFVCCRRTPCPQRESPFEPSLDGNWD